MISKKKLKQRLLDICNGAGFIYCEGETYFEHRDHELKCIGLALLVIEDAFELGETSILRYPINLDKFSNIGELTHLVYRTIRMFDSIERR